MIHTDAKITRLIYRSFWMRIFIWS